MYPSCRTRRGVAQLGSASALGAEGRGFKSRHPDHLPMAFRSTGEIAFWDAYRLRLLCKLRARVSALLRPSRAANPLRLPPCPAEGNRQNPQQNPEKSAPKETEP